MHVLVKQEGLKKTDEENCHTTKLSNKEIVVQI